MLYNLIFWGAPAAALSVYLLLILFFAISKKDRYTAAFQPFLYDMALWTASSLLMKLGIPPGVLFWNRMMMVGICCAPFFFYLFFSIFTGLVRIRRLALWALGTLAAIVFSFMGQVVTSASTVTSWSTWQGKPIAAPPGHPALHVARPIRVSPVSQRPVAQEAAVAARF